MTLRYNGCIVHNLASFQQTIQTITEVTGPLLHAPGHATVVFSPAPEDTGWVFVRSDLPGSPHIPCRPENVDIHCPWTVLHRGRASVSVVEHLLAACLGLGIDNLFISVDTDGIPMPDGGSARPFVDALLSAGTVRQAKPRNLLAVERPEFAAGIASPNSYVIALPGTGFEVVYVLEYPGTPLGTQIVKFDVNPDVFAQEVAPARSFVADWDLNRMHISILYGPAIDGVPVVGSDFCYLQRLPQEAARHKVLDLIGDLALLGQPIEGTFLGIRSGHRLNQKLALRLAGQM